MFDRSSPLNPRGNARRTRAERRRQSEENNPPPPHPPCENKHHGHCMYYITRLMAWDYGDFPRRLVTVRDVTEDGWFYIDDGDRTMRWWHHDAPRIAWGIDRFDGVFCRVGDTHFLTAGPTGFGPWSNCADEPSPCQSDRFTAGDLRL